MEQLEHNRKFAIGLLTFSLLSYNTVPVRKVTFRFNIFQSQLTSLV